MGDTVLDTTTAMLDTPMPTATTDTTARGLLRPRPSPRLMPTPTCCTEATTDTLATSATGPTATPTPTDTTARGLLMPSPWPRPSLLRWIRIQSLLGINDDPRHPDIVLATADWCSIFSSSFSDNISVLLCC